jgi:hypothetical protein
MQLLTLRSLDDLLVNTMYAIFPQTHLNFEANHIKVMIIFILDITPRYRLLVATSPHFSPARNLIAFGRKIAQRAALSGTQAAKRNLELNSIDSRSLFATLIQVHNLWGQVAPRSAWTAREKATWLEGSEYEKPTEDLLDFEQKIPDRHRWSLWNFRGYKTEAVELFCCVKLTTHEKNFDVCHQTQRQ